MDSVRLIELKAENFKRLKAVRLQPTGPVTHIVGKNAQGKTSILDAIESALGGASHSPEMPIRAGCTKAEVVLDLESLIVTRKWSASGSTLLVTTKEGHKPKSPQAILDQLYNDLTFDPLGFVRMPAKKQAEIFAGMAGVNLAEYSAKRTSVYDQRSKANKDRDQAKALFDSLEAVVAPDELVSVTGLMAEMDQGRAINAEAAKLAAESAKADRAVQDTERGIEERKAKIAEWKAKLAEMELELKRWEDHLPTVMAMAEAASTKAHDATTVSTDSIEARIRDVDNINAKVRQKQAKAKAYANYRDAEQLAAKLDQELTDLDEGHKRKIAAAKLPVPNLSFTADGVFLNGVPFGQCSAAEQLRTSVAVCLAMNPKLKIMLIRDGSLLDENGMAILEEMATQHDATVIIERVQTPGESGILIEDGEVAGVIESQVA